jgi:hypothetical protein
MVKIKCVEMEIVNLGNQDFNNEDDQIENANLGRGIGINLGGYPYPECGG